jgi:hypothetical protein
MSSSRYYERKAKGICTLCGKRPPRQGKVYCGVCSEKHKRSNKARPINTVRKASGICIVCGERPAREGRTLCEICLNKARENTLALRRKRVDQGFCSEKGCNRPVVPSRVRCQECLEDFKIKEIALKRKAMELLGGVRCNCCGEDCFDLLSFDHVNSDGFCDLSKNGRKKDTHGILRSVIKGEYLPGELQVLCFSCNCGKHRNRGVCPHVDGAFFVCCERKGRSAKNRCGEHPTTRNEQIQRAARLGLIEAFRVYSKDGTIQCEDCGERNIFFLTFDHPNNDGNEERRRTGKGGIGLAGYLRKRGYPPGYQVRCFNCNYGRQFRLTKVSPYFDIIGVVVREMSDERVVVDCLCGRHFEFDREEVVLSGSAVDGES